MVHKVMEAKKFHSLLSTSWRIRKAEGIIQSEAEGLRTGEVAGFKPLRPTA